MIFLVFLFSSSLMMIVHQNLNSNEINLLLSSKSFKNETIKT